MDGPNGKAALREQGGSGNFQAQPKQPSSNTNKTQIERTPDDRIGTDVDEFMSAIFSDAVGVPVVAAPDFKGFMSQRYRADFVRGQQVYFCISTVKDIPRQRLLQRRVEDCVRTYAVVLDDVASKVPVPLVPPSWILESSPGNFQYGYRLDGGADPGEAAALIKALIAGGHTDPGAGGANRVMRIPGSLNAKPQHNGHRAKVTEWRPDCAYTLDTLAQLFGVSPGKAMVAPSRPQERDGPDPNFDWLLGHGMIKDGPNARGWYSMTCPWEDAHQTPPLDHGTDYKPGDPGVFKCLHGSCAGQSNATLRAWILEQDPEADIGVISRELVASVGEALGRLIEPLARSIFFVLDGKKVRAAIEKDLIHVASEDKYWSIQNNALIKHRALDDILTPGMRAAGLLQRGKEEKSKADMPPHIWLRRNPRVRRVSKLTHRLGSPLIVENCLNIAPPIPEPVSSEAFEKHGVWAVALWLRLVLFLCCRNKTIARTVLDWLAMVVGDYNEKPGWAIMLKGRTQGTGKNLMLLPLAEAVGVEHYQEVTAVTLAEPFNEYLTKRLIVANEIRSTTRGSVTGHDLYAKLKAYTARSGKTVTINAKNMRPYTAADVAAWAFTSNESAPLPLEPSDRRVFVIEPPDEPMPKKFYEAMVEWYNAGGHAACAAYLRDRWARMTEERKRVLRTLPPMTQAKLDVIEMSDDGINSAVRAAISGKYEIFWNDLMTLNDMMTSLKFTMLNAGMITKTASDSVNTPRLVAALKSAGAIRLNDGNPCGRGEKKVRLWLLNPRKRQMYEALGFGAALYDKWVELNPKLSAFDARST